jgi:hypothetical protein
MWNFKFPITLTRGYDSSIRSATVLVSRGASGLNRVLRTVFVSMPLLMVACDPGMSIRQVKAPLQGTVRGAASDADVIISVNTTHQLIGVKWYDPRIKVTNVSNQPITITNIELFARAKTYANEPPQFQPAPYPLSMAPGSTEVLQGNFWLDEDVQNTFQKSAELLVYYKIGEKQGIARVRVVRGSLSVPAT